MSDYLAGRGLALRAHAILAAWEIQAGPDDFLTDWTGDGTAIMALLANAGAKFLNRVDLYEHKDPILRYAIIQLRKAGGRWWAAPHAGYVSPYPHPDGGRPYEVDTVIYLKTGVGQMSFHVASSSRILGPLIASAPTSSEGWNGVAMQPIAKEIALTYLQNRRAK